MSCECKMPDGLTIKPDGINELDPCVYEVEEVYDNVTVEISKCKKCGKINISWYRKPETTEIDPDEWEDVVFGLLGQ